MTETAFSCLNKYRFQVKKDHGSRTAKAVLFIAERFDTTLVVVLIGTNAASVILSVVSTILFTQRLFPTLDPSVAGLISTIVMTIILYLFGETIPKQIGKKIPNKVASIAVYPLLVFYFLIWPIAMVFTGISWLAKKLFPTKEEPEVTEEDFTSAIELKEEEGLIEENESDVIINSIDFSDTAVKEVLTPRRKMFTIDLSGLTNEDIAKIVCETQYSRIPVYEGEINDIKGVLIVKKFLSMYLKKKNFDINKALEKPYIVAPNVKIDDLTDGFRTNHTQSALVYKDDRLVGLVTMEDVLEELVGPIGEKDAIGGEKK
ncbi:MAG: DUF21 domain-containing protein [Bacilli bacterium]|nr:DUF21 domain-containing protein [Bacilli bacterium]